MRLTLRTLLAWVDSVLSPEEQRQLGEQVGESQVARQLVERIGAVVANDQLGAPRLGAKGLAGDANSVAEYLDNALPPERLESFETICLESDVHLAEVAACHAILAEVARDPSVLHPLDAAGRRALLESIEHRMQAHPEVLLGGAAAPVPGAAGAKEARRERAAGRGESHAGGAAVAPVAAEPLREKRRRTPWAAWGTFAGALLLLGVLAAFFARSAGLLQVAPKGQGPRAPEGAVAVAPADAAPALDEPAIAEPAIAEPAIPAPEAVAPGDDLAARDAADGGPSAASEDVPPAAPADDEGMAAIDGATDADATPDGDLPADDAVADVAGTPPAVPEPDMAQGPRKVRAGEALAIAAGVRPGKPAPKAVKAPDAAVADDVGLEGAAAKSGIGFVSADGVVLVRVADGDLVRVEPAEVGGALAAGAELVVPPGMHPEIALGGLALRLQPRAILRVDVDPDGTPRVSVAEGRVVIRAAREGARVAIAAGPLDGRVVEGLEGGVAIESAAAWSGGGEGDGIVRTVRVMPVSRPLGWMPAGDAGRAPTPIPLRAALEAETPLAEVRVTDTAGRPADWMAGSDRLDKLERLAAETFTRRLATLPAGTTPAAGLEQVLDGMAADRRVENRIFAAVSRALVDDYATAVDLLSAEAPGRKLEPVQWAALEGAVVPLSLLRGPESTERLRRAWEDHGPPGRAELLLGMGRGASDADLADGADRTLVDALGDTALVVRRYALAILADITRPSTFDRARFRPDAPEEARRDGVAWWRALLEKGAIRRAP